MDSSEEILDRGKSAIRIATRRYVKREAVVLINQYWMREKEGVI